MISDKFVLVGALINLVGGLIYFRATVTGEAQPNRVTWGLWALAPLIAFAAEIHEHVGLQSLMTFMVGAGPLVIFVTTFIKKNYIWKLGKLDYACGILSVLGIVLWLLTRHGNVAILFSIMADGLAAVPTLVKSYKHPESESAPVFLFSAIAAGITMLTIKNWNLANYGFPAYIFAIGLILFALIQFKLGKKLQPKIVK